MFSQFDTNDDFRESSTHVKNYKSTVYFYDTLKSI